ncbi:cytotoxin leucocidin [Streptomyces sp. AV19]|uniref:cytotoxin leucocidin n=1 Tax=Streptomyces sp. AV19 TaxID=2793068 RepID=UPI0018FEA8FE|nr:cytotoxin leucocidin [Streptomyces sp. AV19]MBH1938738.1 cytotoxin leucocidin [Streptomyces sp. AV19]MDG4533998.1 cytotoxin leucocidin [Streptomyces sp. AV19]
MSHVSRRRLLTIAPAVGVAAAVPVTGLLAAPAASAAPRTQAAAKTAKSKGTPSRPLQEITDAWGRWMAKERFPGSNGCRFTASTDYGRQSALGSYHEHQVRTKYSGITYDPSAPSPVPGQVSSVATNYRNGTDVEQTVTYKQSRTTEQDLRISVTESLKVGVTVQVSAEVPAVAKVSETTSIEATLSSTQEFSHKETQNWSVDLPLKIPAKSVVEASLVVGTQKYDIDWTATVGLTGSVAIWFEEKVDLNHDGDRHWLWFVPVEEVFRDCRANGIVDTSGYEVTADGVNAFASGTFSGGQGVSLSINAVQKPLDGRAKRSAAATGRTIPVPLSASGRKVSVPGR